MRRLNIKKENLVALIIISISAFFFLTLSPLHPWIGGETGTDSSVFKTVALMMEHGYMPYKDSFDHKGPLLYFLNFIGNKISSYSGIWVIEFIFFIVTFFTIYKICRLVSNWIGGAIVSLLALVLLSGYFYEGNMSEEYAMPFIAVSIYIFADYFLNSIICKSRLIICGLCMAAVLMLRPNMITLWFVFCISILIDRLIHKDYKSLLYFLSYFIIGVAIVVIPFTIWLLFNNAFSDFLFAYFKFNMMYSSDSGGLVTFVDKNASFFYFLNTVVFITALVSIIYEYIQGKKLFDLVYIVYMFLSLILLCMSGQSYEHYGMVLVPLIAYPLARVFYEIEKIEIQSISKILQYIVCLYLIVNVISPVLLPIIQNVPNTFYNRNQEHRYPADIMISNLIDANTTPSDSISVYGNLDVIYVMSNRVHATKYSFQRPIGDVYPTILDKYFDELQQELPPIIVVSANNLDDRMTNFLNNNEYSLLWSEFGDDLSGKLVYQK